MMDHYIVSKNFAVLHDIGITIVIPVTRGKGDSSNRDTCSKDNHLKLAIHRTFFFLLPPSAQHPSNEKSKNLGGKLSAKHPIRCRHSSGFLTAGGASCQNAIAVLRDLSICTV